MNEDQQHLALTKKQIKPSSMQHKTKLHIGCGKRNFGSEWVNVDGNDFPHVEIVTNNLIDLPFDDETFDIIYASHVIAYFDREEVQVLLTEWRRVLKLGGILRLATPDFQVLSSLYLNKTINLMQVLGPVYGKMPMSVATIYHKTTYDFFSLNSTVISAGFSAAKRYDWRETEHAHIDDHSQAYIPHMDKVNGTLISLNIECQKI